MSRLTLDGTAKSVSRGQIFGANNGDREKFIFPVQLTTSRIGNEPYPVDLYSATGDDNYYVWCPTFYAIVSFQVSTDVLFY